MQRQLAALEIEVQPEQKPAVPNLAYKLIIPCIVFCFVCYILLRRAGNDIGALHEVVGPDGVLMISLQTGPGPKRFATAIDLMREVKIHPAKFIATDAKAAASEELRMSCPLQDEVGVYTRCTDHGKFWPSPEVGLPKEVKPGCSSKGVQACGASHRRALEAALQRNHDWTAILEDDAAPLNAIIDTWNQDFKKAWEALSPETKLVRLQYCPQGSNRSVSSREIGAFRIIDWIGAMRPDGSTYYHPGTCTGAYIVHKSAIPDLIGVFPCCADVDWCWWSLFTRQENETSKPWGSRHMVTFDAQWGNGYTERCPKRGVITQNARVDGSIEDHPDKFKVGLPHGCDR